MTHLQDEGHYQEQMNAQAKAEYDAMGEAMQQEAQAEMKAQISEKNTTETIVDWSEMEYTGKRELSFGEKLVGLTFNPSGDAKVQRAKELCSELADLLNEHNSSKPSNQFTQRLFSHAIGEILNAQMNVVKVLTLKY